MAKFTKIIYQVVFATRGRSALMRDKEKRRRIHAYMTGMLQKRNCFVYTINGIEDHVHVLFGLSTTHALGAVVKDIKLGTGKYAREELHIAQFYWGKGYGAFTYSNDSLPSLIAYIEQQEEHHRKKTFREELIQLLKRHDVTYEEAWLDDM